jgi:hypothetical protein
MKDLLFFKEIEKSEYSFHNDTTYLIYASILFKLKVNKFGEMLFARGSSRGSAANLFLCPYLPPFAAGGKSNGI